mgnify:CR=1 FL=1
MYKSTHVSTFFKENTESARADVRKNDGGNYYFIDYYDQAGTKFYTQAHNGKTLGEVKSIAEDGALNSKVLFG